MVLPKLVNYVNPDVMTVNGVCVSRASVSAVSSRSPDFRMLTRSCHPAACHTDTTTSPNLERRGTSVPSSTRPCASHGFDATVTSQRLASICTPLLSALDVSPSNFNERHN